MSATAALDPWPRERSSKGLGHTDQRCRILSAYEFAYVILELVDEDIYVLRLPFQITARLGLGSRSQFLLE